MKESRRLLIKTMPLGLPLTVSQLPLIWTKPVVQSVLLPAHAQTTIVGETQQEISAACQPISRTFNSLTATHCECGCALGDCPGPINFPLNISPAGDVSIGNEVGSLPSRPVSSIEVRRNPNSLSVRILLSFESFSSLRSASVACDDTENSSNQRAGNDLLATDGSVVTGVLTWDEVIIASPGTNPTISVENFLIT